LFASFGLAAITAANVIVARQIAKRVKQGVIAFARIQAITLDTPNEPKSDAWVPPMGFEVIADHSVMVSAAGFEDRCRDIRDILQRSIVAGNCDHVVVTSAWKNRTYIEALLQELGPLPAPVFLLSDNDLTKLSRQRHVVLGDRLGFELQSAPLGRIDRAMKRALDVGLAMSAIIFLSPLMLLAAIAIRLESGSPVFFSQDRRGFGGVPFKIMKFRTMTVSENGPNIPQAKRGDPRITRFGRILRRTSMDELPQLFNVLKGEMSIVGPRPHAMAHDDHYDQIIERYSFRHHVKPGITGWAQVNGHRGATETSDAMQARIEHDLWYINHWSIWLDVKIILRTAFKVLADTNAY
jgi:Undecaprenyl-phosphate glucose phosphotransferase